MRRTHFDSIFGCLFLLENSREFSFDCLGVLFTSEDPHRNRIHPAIRYPFPFGSHGNGWAKGFTRGRAERGTHSAPGGQDEKRGRCQRFPFALTKGAQSFTGPNKWHKSLHSHYSTIDRVDSYCVINHNFCMRPSCFLHLMKK